MSYRVIVDHLRQALCKLGETGLWGRGNKTQNYEDDEEEENTCTENKSRYALYYYIKRP